MNASRNRNGVVAYAPRVDGVILSHQDFELDSEPFDDETEAIPGVKLSGASLVRTAPKAEGEAND